MTSQPIFKEEWDALSAAHNIASSLTKMLSDTYNINPSPHPPTYPSTTVIPDLVLPYPHDILAPISQLQVPDDLRQGILRCFDSSFNQLQQQYTLRYRRVCMAGLQAASLDCDLKAVHRAYQALYQRQCIPMLRSRVSFVLAEVAKRLPMSCDVKRPFNAEYTPVLEKYFAYNAYPSAKHQEILAEKSMMLRRQIEVWFQNHRNRAKKEGKDLKRFSSTSDYPLQLALSILQEGDSSHTDRSPTPSDEDSASENMDEDDDLPQPTSCIEGPYSFRPEHVFPAEYPPTCPDPFPAENGVFKFPPPTWIRTPANSAPSSIKSLPIDMDEFTRMFHSNMNISKPNILDGTRKRAKSPKAGQPWFAATVTVPPKAPHPAFVRAPPPSRSSPTILPTASNFSFQFPVGSRSTSTFNAFLPPSQPDASKSRKMSPLPRRLPRSPTTGPSLKTLSSSSRSSSFSSDTSSRSRISSSSRNSTPEPSTPPQLPSMDFPGVQDAGLVPQIPNEFDFSALFGDNPDLFTNLPSGNFDLSNSMNPMLNKQTHAPLFDFDSFISLPTSDYVHAQS